jgi:hypothetical protein
MQLLSRPAQAAEAVAADYSAGGADPLEGAPKS